MDQQPDYSKYAEPELLQIRKHIDAARYPERVAEIEARLAALAAAPTATQSIHEDLSPVTIAKLWRRVVAFKIDSMLFFIIGLIAGEFLSDQFAALGPWGKVLGFAIATTYFGVSQSSIGGGQSLGMKILGIKVSTSSGTSLGLRASLIRAGIFCLYYFLSGLPSFPAHGELPIPGILMPLLGVGFCSLYLLTFNRKTRQGLHDWAVRVCGQGCAWSTGSANRACLARTCHSCCSVVASVLRGGHRDNAVEFFRRPATCAAGCEYAA